jgi:hypothetical protein
VGGRCRHCCGQNSISQTLLTKILVNLLTIGAKTRRPVIVELGAMHRKAKDGLDFVSVHSLALWVL